MFLIALNANLTPALHESVHYILTTVLCTLLTLINMSD